MKNLFILPTDKLSRLAILHDNKLHIGTSFKKDFNVKPQNIYITSDEEIKEGDWHLNIKNNKISKYNIGLLNPNRSNYKKIILTDNQDLIKDGVQAIDDEFLEWFVKNPSCEEVGVKKEMYMPFDGKVAFELSLDPKLNTRSYYKIIIPKEEPNFYEKLVEYFKNTPREKILEDWNKTAECDNIGPTVEEFLGNTEETLEQAAIRLYPDNIIKLGNETSYNAALLKRKDFIDGGNWVKERMYSEEDMREAIHESRMQDDKYEDCIFEQFKKK